MMTAMQPTDLPADNPFGAPSTLPYGLPDFTRIREEHYRPALLAGMAQQRAEIDAIATDPAAPTVENTLEALERSGRLLHRAVECFYNQSSADSTPGLDAIEEELAPQFAAHLDAIYLDAAPVRPRRRAAGRRRLRRARARAGHRVAAAPHAHEVRPLRRRARRGVAGPPARPERRDHEPRGRVRSPPAGGHERRRRPGDRRGRAGRPARRRPRRRGAWPPASRGHEEGWFLELALPTQQAPLAALRDRGLRERVFRASAGRGASGRRTTPARRC